MQVQTFISKQTVEGLDIRVVGGLVDPRVKEVRSVAFLIAISLSEKTAVRQKSL